MPSLKLAGPMFVPARPVGGPCTGVTPTAARLNVVGPVRVKFIGT